MASLEITVKAIAKIEKPEPDERFLTPVRECPIRLDSPIKYWEYHEIYRVSKENVEVLWPIKKNVR